MSTSPWKPVMKYIRMRIHNGREQYMVQMGGRENRRAKVVASLGEALLVRDEWAKGGVPVKDADKTPAPDSDENTVEDAVWNYVAELEGRQKRKTAQNYRALAVAMRRDDPRLAAAPCAAVTVKDLFHFRSQREQAGLKPQTIRLNLINLLASLRAAGTVFDKFALKGLLPPNVDRVKELSPREWQVALMATPEPFRTMVRFTAALATRLGDVCRLRIEWIDWRDRVVRFPKTKTGPMDVLLGNDMLAVLRQAADGRTQGLLFPSPGPKQSYRMRGIERPYSGKHVYDIWKNAVRRAGRPDFTFHDLKHHSVMSVLNDEQASLADIKDHGHWKSMAMISKYAKLRESRQRDIQDRLMRRQAAGPVPGRGGRRVSRIVSG